MVRLLIERNLIKHGAITLHVRFKGGANQTSTLPQPLRAWELRMIPAEVVAEIDRLLDHYTEGQIAVILNERGLHTGEGKSFHSRIVARIRRAHRLKPRYDRLRAAGMLTLAEMATSLGTSIDTVKKWGHHGLLQHHAYNDKQECLYEHPGDNPPIKSQGEKSQNDADSPSSSRSVRRRCSVKHKPSSADDAVVTVPGDNSERGAFATPDAIAPPAVLLRRTRRWTGRTPCRKPLPGAGEALGCKRVRQSLTPALAQRPLIGPGPVSKCPRPPPRCSGRRTGRP